MLNLLHVAFAAPTFSFDNVVDIAQQLAGQPLKPPQKIPEILDKLKYDQFRDIRFIPEKALWRAPGMNFDVQFFHPGLYFKHAVKINVINKDRLQEVPFSPDLFDYGQNQIKDKIPADLGFAGFVLNYPIKSFQQQNQVIVFVGASYFRAVGEDNVYGLSARGLAIDTGLRTGEEFPFFREFWLEKPSPYAERIRIYGLLDSQRVTGAYEFTIIPGKTTAVDVKATLFEREKVAELGIAPLTSMFLYGEKSKRPEGYWRPEIHDSDGLLLHNGNGEWIWRPLDNGNRLRISSLSLDHPQGFGLLQRDREFLHYEDLETHQELRPTAWVIPKGDWGSGRVKLTEIPSDSEINDNIVAYWIQDTKPKLGKPINIAYRLEWRSSDPDQTPMSKVTATRMGDGSAEEGAKKFVLDFEGGTFNELPEDISVEAVISVGKAGELLDQLIIKNEVTGGRRLVFQVLPPANEPLELRVFLKSNNKTLSETWSYLLDPRG